MGFSRQEYGSGLPFPSPVDHILSDLSTMTQPESEEELKNFLMKVKEESEKVGLKRNIQKIKIMASGPTTT